MFLNIFIINSSKGLGQSYPKIFSVFLVLSLLSVFPTHATANDSDPFVQILTRALGNNPEIMTAQANLVAARERLPQSRAALLPNIALNVTPNHSYSTWRGGDRTENTLAAGLTLSQILYNKPALVAFKQTTPLIGAFEDDLSAAVQNVFLKVVEATVHLLQTKEVAKLAKNNLVMMQRHLAATQARFQFGRITHTNVSQAEARLASARAKKVQADSDIAIAQARFRAVVGTHATEIHTLPTPTLPEFQQVPGSGSLDAWLAQQELRPDLHAVQKRLHVAELAVEMARAGHWPMLALTSSAHHSWQHDTIDEVDHYALGMNMEFPLFAGGMIVSKVAEAQAQRDAQVAQVDRVRRQAQQEVEQSYWALQTAQALTIAFGSVVMASESAKHGIEREFQVGSRTALDLLDAQHELFSNQTEQAKSRYRLQRARFQLLHAVGRLNLEELVFKAQSDP